MVKIKKKTHFLEENHQPALHASLAGCSVEMTLVGTRERVALSANETRSAECSRSPRCNKSAQTCRRLRRRDYRDADVIRKRVIDGFDITERVDFVMVFGSWDYAHATSGFVTLRSKYFKCCFPVNNSGLGDALC